MTVQVEPIVIVTTGGTIDKIYFDALSSYQVGETVVEHLLKVGRVQHPYRIVEAFRKDSLDLNDDDRNQLQALIAALHEKRVVITHGTDTMTQTAAVLAAIPNKTMVLVGALAPARFAESDAAFNLGMAIATVQTATPGVYITMNGQVFRGDQVRKDRASARFVSLE